MLLFCVLEFLFKTVLKNKIITNSYGGNIMKCENCYCVYQTKGKCILEKISIDISGMCKECIYVNVDKEVLTEKKLKLLKNFEEE